MQPFFHDFVEHMFDHHLQFSRPIGTTREVFLISVHFDSIFARGRPQNNIYFRFPLSNKQWNPKTWNFYFINSWNYDILSEVIVMTHDNGDWRLQYWQK